MYYTHSILRTNLNSNFNFRIMDMREQGMFFKWKEIYWPKSNKCQPPGQAEAMRLDDLQGVFYLLFVSLGLGSCILIIEIIFHHIPWDKNDCSCTKFAETLVTKMYSLILIICKRNNPK